METAGLGGTVRNERADLYGNLPPNVLCDASLSVDNALQGWHDGSHLTRLVVQPGCFRCSMHRHAHKVP